MRFILVLLFSLSAYAQHTSTCCRVDSVAAEVIGEEFIAKQCLICNTIETENISDQLTLSSDEAVIDKQLSLALKYCKISQDRTIELIIDLLKSYKKQFKDENLISFKSVLQSISLLINADITNKLGHMSLSENLKSKVCHEKEAPPLVPDSLKSYISTLNQISKEYRFTVESCPGYIENKQEKAIFNLLNTITTLSSSQYENTGSD